MKNLSAFRLLVLSAVLVASAFLAKEVKAETAPCVIVGIPCSADMYFHRSTVGQPKVLGASTTSVQCSLFNRNLRVGSRGADVMALQNFLMQKGFLIVPSGVSLGYFGAQTRAALARYQASKNIRPVDGYFGPITRQAVIADCGAIVEINPANASVQVVSPNGGEGYLTGDNLEVKWLASNFSISSNVYIELRFRSGNNVGGAAVNPVKIAVVSSAGGSYLWQIPANTTPGQYVIEIYRADQNGNIDPNESVKDVSDTTFTISDQNIPEFPLIDTTATCPSTTFARDLTVGDQGNDVAALQNFLKAKGYSLESTSGYFGPSTRAALAAYQVTRGITPAEGAFGPITRATVNADCSSVGTTTVSSDSDGGKNYFVKGTTTGLTRCVDQSQCMTPSTSVDVCWKDDHQGTTGNENQLHEYFIGADGYKYVEFYQSPTGCENGAAKATSTQPPIPNSVTVLSPNGGERYAVGSAATIAWKSTSTTSPVYINWLQDRDGDGSYEMVYGLFGSNPQLPTGNLSWTVPAYIFSLDSASERNKISIGTSDGNATVTDLSDAPFSIGTSASTSTSTSTIIANATTASLVVNSLHSVTVNVGDTVKYDWTSTGGDTYSSVYANVGTGATCPAGGSWTITNANGKYGTVSSVIPASLSGCAYTIMYTVKNSLTGKVATDSINVRVNTQIASAPTVTLSASANPLQSQTYTINSLNGVQGVPILNFNLKAETADAQILGVSTSATVTGTPPTTLYLYLGNILLKSRTYSASGVTFDALDLTSGSLVPVNTIQTYTIKADFPSNTVNNTVIKSTVDSVLYKKGTTTAIAGGSAVVGVNQYLNTASAIFALSSTPTIQVSGISQTGTSLAMIATFNFNVTAQGGDMIQPTNSDFAVKFATSPSGAQLAASSVSVVTIPNNNIANGRTASVTVSAQIPAANVPVSGLYNAYISSIKWQVGANAVTQTYGLENYKTLAAANFIASQGSLSSAKAFLAFSFAAQGATGVIDEVNHTVSVTVPYGTALTALTPSITISPNATVSPVAGGTAQNFTTPKVYTVRAQDGSTQTYTVTVTLGVGSSAKAITGFSFANPVTTGTINETNRTISVTVPFGIVLTALTPTIAISPNATVSPVTGSVQNFTTPKVYTVTAQDGSTQTYLVTVTPAPVVPSATFALTSTPTIRIDGTNQNGSSTSMSATFTFNVTAKGGTMNQPANRDFIVKFATSPSATQLEATSVSVITIPNTNIADGSTATVTVTAQMPNFMVPASGLYNAYISRIAWTVGSNSVSQTTGLETFKTSAASNFIK